MAEKNQLQMCVPETYAEELWHLQGKVEALEGYLRAVYDDGYPRNVPVGMVASIMGINLTEEGDK